MTTTLKFMTFNIRHDHHPHSIRNIFAAPPNKDSPLDPTEFKGEQPWSIRKWKIVDTILLYSPDILGVQEPVIHQLEDMKILLGDEYDWIGAGRNNGDKEGEFTAIFYKKQILTVQDWKIIWLSKEPEVVGSVGWDAKYPRIATQATFKTQNDSVFTVLNAHLDHKGAKSREESAKLMLEKARGLSELGPVFLIGDLNSTEYDPAYTILTNSKYRETKGQNDTLANLNELNEVSAGAYSLESGEPISIGENHMVLPTHHRLNVGNLLSKIKNQQAENDEPVEEKYFDDAQYELITRIKSKGGSNTFSGPYGFRDTFTSFGEGEEYTRAPIRIDFIMPLQTHKVDILQFAVLPNEFDDGLLISDHRPVLSTLSW